MNDHRSEIAQAVRAHAREYLARPGVTGVRVGTRTVGGKPTEEMALVVEVEKKRPRGELQAGELVPGHLHLEVNGTLLRLATDVQEVGLDRLQRAADEEVRDAPGDRLVLDQRLRPAPGGVQIEAENIDGTGTLGVNIRWRDRLRLITNNHVISENGNVGAVVYQPSAGSMRNRLTRVSGFDEVRTQPDKDRPEPHFNRRDVAWCDVDEEQATRDILHLGIPAGVRAPVAGERIRLVGKETGAVQHARIADIHLRKVLRWPDETGDWAFFDEQIQLDRVVTQAGDSGSAYVAESDNRVVGIHVAANASYSWGCPLV